MKPVIERISDHFRDSTGDGRKFIDIPEWGETPQAPLRIYWKPVTLAERKRIIAARYPDALALVLKAEDAAGKPLFDEFQDMKVLAHEADARIVTRVAEAIFQVQSVSDAEKN